MHNEVIEKLEQIKLTMPGHFKFCRVLEIGSLDINGSPRRLFKNCYYIGIDIVPGPGVDYAIPGHKYRSFFKFTTVLCLETLEHDKHWKETLQNIYKLTHRNGLIIITAAGPQREEHGTATHKPEDSPATNDYYKNITFEMVKEALPISGFSYYNLTYSRDDQDIYFIGIKK